MLKLLDTMKQEHTEGQRDLRQRLEQLHKEVATGQEDATQWVVKRLKEDRTLVFKKKENERQFLFNNNMKDQIHTQEKPLDLVEPNNDTQKVAQQKAKSELEKGLTLLEACQKQIKLADRSEYGWPIVDEYKDHGLTLDKDDTKRIEKSKMAVVESN